VKRGFAAFEEPDHRSVDVPNLIPGLDQLIAKPPMVLLRVLVLHVFTNGILK
tara:strand:- start:278 stop:433 length:156 start_codon:yes stop_codon:yes gene_type:complete